MTAFSFNAAPGESVSDLCLGSGGMASALRDPDPLLVLPDYRAGVLITAPEGAAGWSGWTP